jgi:hypothetical protein
MYTTVLSRERWREERESNKTTTQLSLPVGGYQFHIVKVNALLNS